MLVLHRLGRRGSVVRNEYPPRMRLPDEHGSGAPPGNGECDDPNAGIGPRVSAVFTAAERAADHIVQMARAEVEDIRRQAESEAQTMRQQQREEAEQEARSIIASAQAEAEAIRADALRDTAEVEESARRREQAILDRIRYMSDRAEWARHSLTDALSHVEEFIARAPSEWPEPPPIPAAPPPLRPSRSTSRRSRGWPRLPSSPSPSPRSRRSPKRSEPEPEAEEPSRRMSLSPRSPRSRTSRTEEPEAEEEPPGTSRRPTIRTRGSAGRGGTRWTS